MQAKDVLRKLLVILTTTIAAYIASANYVYAQNRSKALNTSAIEQNLSTCLDKTSTLEQIECIGRNYENADKLLNQYYKLLMKKLPPQNAEDLKSSQRRWVVQYTNLNKQLNKNYQEDQGTIQRVLCALTGCNFVLNRASYLELLVDNNIQY